MRVQRDRLADARQLLVHAEWNRELVGNAARRHDLHAVELFALEGAVDLGDHARPLRARTLAMVGSFALMRHASAAATPSAASDGCGTDFNFSNRVSMNCTCSFVAAPVPTTAFLISAGGSS